MRKTKRKTITSTALNTRVEILSTFLALSVSQIQQDTEERRKISDQIRINELYPIVPFSTSDDSGLTYNEKIFANEWCIDRNGTRAYRVAFERCKNRNVAGVEASRMLRKPTVAAYVNERLEEISRKAKIDVQWVLERYKKLVDYSVDDFLDGEGNLKPLDEIPRDSLYAVCGFKNYRRIIKEGRNGSSKIVKTLLHNLKLTDKKGVLDSLGKYLGMFEKDNAQRRPVLPVQINVTLED